MTHLKFYIKSVLCSLVFFILLILFIKNIYYPALKITIEVIMTFSIGSLCYAIFCKTNRAAFLPISVVLFLLTLYLMGGQYFSRNFVSLHFSLGEIVMVILISVVVTFLYYVITDYFKNSYLDCILFLTLLISHLIWNYYFLPIEILVALSGVNLLSRFFKKREVNRFVSELLKRKVKLGYLK